MIRTTLAAAVLMTASLSASAAPASPLYAGAAIGQADYRADCEGATTCDDKVGAGKVYLGFNLDDAAEGALRSSIETSYFRGATATAGADGFEANARIHGIGVAYKASYQVGAVELNGRVGGAYTRSRVEVPGFFTDRASTFGATYGIGAAFNVSEAVALTLDVERVPAKYGDEKQGANLYTAGLRMSF